MPLPLTRLVSELHRLAESPAPDADLLERFARHRDEAAFTTLVERHGPMVLRLCRRVLGDAHAAEDALQATFLILARKAGTLDQPAALAGWLYGVAQRVALKARRTGLRGSAVTGSAVERPDPTPDPLSAMTARDLLVAMEEELARLPATYRMAVVACCLEGHSREEAAALLGCTPGALRGWLERGRALLHNRLVRRGLTLSAAFAAAEIAQSSVGAAAISAAVKEAVVSRAASAAATQLAGEVLRGAPLVRLVPTLLVTFALGVGAMWLARTEEQIAAPPTPGAPTHSPVPTVDAPHFDLHGDALPPGAIARLGTIRFRHGHWVGCIALSGNGRTLFSAGSDHTIRIWEAATGRESRRIVGHDAPIYFLALTPDGKNLISASSGDQKDVSVRVWDAETGREVRRLFGGRPAVSAFALSPNGELLAGGRRSEVSLAEVTGGQVLGTCRMANGDARAARFSPDGTTLAVIFDAVGVCLFDVKTTKLLWHNGDQPTSDHGPGIAFAPDGKTLAVALGNKEPMRILETAAGKEVRRFQGTPSAQAPLLFSRDGKRIFTNSFRRYGLIWDVATAKQIGALEPPPSEIHHLELSSDGKTLATAGSRAVQLWDADTGKARASPSGARSYIQTLAVSPDGKSLLASAAHDHEASVRMWDLSSSRQQLALPSKVGARTAVFAPDGKTFAVGSHSGSPSLVDTASARTIREFEGKPGFVELLAFSVDGKRLLGGGLAYEHVRVWAVDTGKELPPFGPFPQGGGLGCLAVAPGGKLLATGGMDAVVRLWDTDSHKEVRQLKGHQGAIWGLTFSPDGRSLAAVTPKGGGIFVVNKTDPDIRIWDVDTGELRKTIKGPVGGSWSIAWSPDSRLLATGGEDGSVRLWETWTGEECLRLTGHEGLVCVVAFTPDSARLISGSSDSTALVWDLATAGRPSKSVAEAQLQSLWDDLAITDARKARQAVLMLAGAPKLAVPLFRGRLKPVLAADEKKVRRWIADLDSDDFETRKSAYKELERVGSQLEPAIKQTLMANPTLEKRRRLEQLLTSLRVVPPEELRMLRAVQALELIGTPDAITVLQTQTKGAAGAPPTREAQQSLDRLNTRAGSLPP